MDNTFTSIFHEEVIKFPRSATNYYMPRKANDNKPKKKIVIKKSDTETRKNVDQAYLHTAAFGNKNDRKRLKRAEAEAKEKARNNELTLSESFLDFDII